MALVVRELGATAGQGFALSPAVDHEELRALLRDIAAGRRHMLNVIDVNGTLEQNGAVEPNGAMTDSA
jgi:hypothetical protein